MLALVDESVQFAHGPAHYVVAAATIVDDPANAREVLRTRLFEDPNRTRPFHWATEGARIRLAMLRCLTELNVTIHAGIHHPTGERDQEHARALLLTDVLLPQLLDAGVTDLLIESRDNHPGSIGPQDIRDLQTIRNYLRPWRGTPTFSWAGKDEPLLWVADAVAGIIREHADHTNTTWFQQLRNAGIQAQITWIGPDRPAPKMRQPRLPS